MPKFAISRMQYFFIIPSILFDKAIGITTGVMVRRLGADTWVSMTIGFILGILVVLLMTYLCSKFGDKTIIELSEELLGKWFSVAVTVLLTVYFILSFGVSANVMTMHISQYFLPETPFILICILWIVICMYAVYLGIEVTARFSLISFLMVVLITVTMVTGTMQDIKPINLLPLMDKGLMADITGSVYIFSDIAMAVFAVALLYPLLNSTKKVFGITFWAMVTGAVLTILWPLFETMVLGPGLMANYCVVCMQQIRCAQLTRYMPRYELIMVSFFVFVVLIQSVIMFFGAEHCIQRLVGARKSFLLLIPLTILMVLVTYFMGVDHIRYVNFIAFPYSQICLGLSLGLPLILLVAMALKGKLNNARTHTKW
ncbi:MAG: GerAB/ArcD/ProY family transporter [Candidatus Saccharibacteria bacterium]